MNNQRTWWDKFWKDKHGKLVIIQPANVPLIGWAAFTLLSKLLAAGSLKTVSEFVAFICLVIWASLEAVRGASYFRRILGVVVLFVSIYGRIA